MVSVNLFLQGVSALTAVMALVLALVVFRAQSESRINRRLAALLVADGIFLGYLTLSDLIPSEAVDTILVNLVLSFDALAHFLFVVTLDSPTARILRRRWIVLLAIVLTIFVAVLLPIVGVSQGMTITDENDDLQYGAGWPFLACASIFALGVTLDSYLRTPKGTPSRKRTGMFALAFGMRDASLAITIFGWAALIGGPYQHYQNFLPMLLNIGSLLFVALLAYALLSVQLFDIDLKIKWGAARGTVVVFIVIAALIVAKIVEFYLNKTLGLVFGGVAAGLTLFFAPRLNKLADKVANKALPAVQPTSGYLTFKKLEVYRAAVESAMEGGITPKDRGMLDRLQTKLGLAKDDAAAVEHELIPGPATGIPAPAA